MPTIRRFIVRCAGIAAATIALTAVAHRLIPPGAVCPDFIQFWTAAKLLSSGRNPYDARLQAEIQSGLGWDAAGDGLGIYEFLPYYYPPWLGLACAPLLPLGYPLARITWLVVSGELLIGAAWLLKDAAAGVPPRASFVLVVAFGPSVLAVLMGQVAPLILFLIAAAWALWKTGRRDFAVGGVLALMLTKPQSTGLLVLGLLCRAACTRRWGVVRGFAAVLAVLCLPCFVAAPGWPLAMVWATRATPLPYIYFPGAGCSWFIALQALGARGVVLGAGYCLAAIPLAVVVIRLATDRRRRLEDLICACLVGAFFIAPYSRNYDLPILLIPALVVTGGRVREPAAGVLLIALTAAPYIQHLTIAGRLPRAGAVMMEYTYFWIPLTILAVWRLTLQTSSSSSSCRRRMARPSAGLTTLEPLGSSAAKFRAGA